MMIRRICISLLRRLYFLFPDKLYVKIRYYLEMGKRLDLTNPMTMNEKLQWLKLYNRNPEYTAIVDKILVKNYIAETLGEEYVVPILGVWNTPDQIDFQNLPERFVLKTNHSGGNTGVVVCSDKTSFNITEAKRKLSHSLKLDIYSLYREWPYKNINKKVFAEAYLGDDLVDYKFYCYNGYVDAVLLCVDRQQNDPKFYFFDKDWNLKRYNERGKEAPIDFSLPKPHNIDKMFEIAAKLSVGYPFVRVDLYNVDERIYFGEMTFFPASGYDSKRLPEADLLFGNLIDLSTSYGFHTNN